MVGGWGVEGAQAPDKVPPPIVWKKRRQTNIRTPEVLTRVFLSPRGPTLPDV